MMGFGKGVLAALQISATSMFKTIHSQRNASTFQRSISRLTKSIQLQFKELLQSRLPYHVSLKNDQHFWTLSSLDLFAEDAFKMQ